MEEIQLKKSKWWFDATRPIGKAGGFGAVYHGKSLDGEDVAIKRLHVGAVDSAHRELRVADLIASKSAAHIIPVFDSGEDTKSGSYFIVMPIAAGSLQERIYREPALSQEEVRGILLEISRGLSELAGLVHRDLKPANILFHDGKWKLADFGIARFVEESTSLQTLKDCLSAPYAAPEQWQYLRATPATDLYALGCIAYQLLSGDLVFAGPDMDDYREQHVMRQPRPLPSEVAPQLHTLVSMLLRKAPESRPDLKRVQDLLTAATIEHSRNSHPLAQAAARVEQANSRAESEAAERKSISDARQRLAESGRDILVALFASLRQEIERQAPTARMDAMGKLRLGTAYLSLPMPHETRHVIAITPDSLPHSKIDMVSLAQMILQQDEPEYSWSCSLMYSKLPHSAGYRWYEVGFRRTMEYDDSVPFSLFKSAGDTYPFRNFDLALAPIMHSYSPALGPVLIDDEGSPDFVDRWTHLFALAAEGKLKHPQGLPLMGKFWEATHF